jgi:AcrR family transcriptional regulator
MSDPRDPIRQQLAEARRAQILDAAARVFAEKGFHRATTREVAEQAGLSEGTIYYYFDSKTALVVGIMARLAAAVAPSFYVAEAPEDVREFYAALFRQRQEFVKENREMLHALLSELLTNRELRDQYRKELVVPFLSQLEEHIGSLAGQGQIRDLDTALAARFIAAVNVGLLGLYILGEPLLAAEWDKPGGSLADTLTSFLIDGVANTEAGQEKGVGK